MNTVSLYLEAGTAVHLQKCPFQVQEADLGATLKSQSLRVGKRLAGMEVGETGLSGHPRLRGATHKHFIPKSVITVSTWFHLVPAVEWGSLYHLPMESRWVSSEACLNYLLTVKHYSQELGRKEGKGHNKKWTKKRHQQQHFAVPDRSQDVARSEGSGLSGAFIEVQSTGGGSHSHLGSCYIYTFPGLPEPTEADSPGWGPRTLYFQHAPWVILRGACLALV